MKNKKGLTLTEVLIVVVIIALFASLVLPRFFAQDERGVVAEAVAILSALRQADAAYLLDHIGHAPDVDDLDVEIPATAIRFTYATDGAGNFTATRDGGRCDDRTITLGADGAFGGDHPFGPVPGDGACDS